MIGPRPWARERTGDAEWHLLLDEARLGTVCGATLQPPVEKRDEPPGFRDAACPQCYVRATDVAEASATTA